MSLSPCLASTSRADRVDLYGLNRSGIGPIPSQANTTARGFRSEHHGEITGTGKSGYCNYDISLSPHATVLDGNQEREEQEIEEEKRGT
jgi:hypothetical protein